MITGSSGIHEEVKPGPAAEENDLATRLLAAMLSANLPEVRPQLDLANPLGFYYPLAEAELKTTSEALLPVLESLAGRGLLKKAFFDRMMLCSHCQSMNLRPSTHCPKCGSSDISRGMVLEHRICKHIAVEEEFVSGGRFVCPKCQIELRTTGVDYQSLGLLRKCNSCQDVFNLSALRWRCLKCSSIFAEDKVKEINLYSYSLDEAKRGRLEFETKPKQRLIQFLRQRGYQVVEDARVKGLSGAQHSIDLLATRDDGLAVHQIAMSVEVAGDRISGEKVLRFDDMTYDARIHDKVLLVRSPPPRDVAIFCDQRRIKVFEVSELERVLSAAVSRPPEPVEMRDFEFNSISQTLEFLKDRGYEVVENARIRGRSGAEHQISMLATRDDALVVHQIAIGCEVDRDRIGLDRVFAFDDKAYDAGIHDKAFIAVPGLTREAGRFAERQRIRVLEAGKA